MFRVELLNHPTSVYLSLGGHKVDLSQEWDLGYFFLSSFWVYFSCDYLLCGMPIAFPLPLWAQV